MTDLEFYYTVASGGSRKALREAQRDDTVVAHSREIDLSVVEPPESVMVSHATQMNEPWPGPSWFIDSGGYSTLDATGEYDESVRDYMEFIAHHEDRDGVEIDRYALRDWACERELLRDTDRSVRLHQNWTIRDHVECLELAEELGIEADPVAVVQGNTIDEYLRHIDYYRDYGLLTDHLGIGSICKRKDVEEIRSLIGQIRDAVPSRVTLHGFGVTQNILHHSDVVSALDSVDTAAWGYKAYQNAVLNGSKGTDRYTWDNVLDCYQSYRERTETILETARANDREIQVVSLSAFDPMSFDRNDSYPILECDCGAFVDPGAPDLYTPGCRNCKRSAETYSMALDGLLCEPELGEHHPMCRECLDSPEAGLWWMSGSRSSTTEQATVAAD